MVKENCNDSVLKYLLVGNETKSKLKDLKYYKLQIQPYLLCPEISTEGKNISSICTQFNSCLTTIDYLLLVPVPR